MSIQALARRRLARLRTLHALTSSQDRRLAAIIELLDDDGTFLLRDALAAGDFSTDDTRAQDGFRDFQQKINAAARAASVPIAITLDSRKTTPDHRRGWLDMGDLTDELVTECTRAATADLPAEPLAPWATATDHTAALIHRRDDADGEPVAVAPALAAWAGDETATRVGALLGDAGVGKTTTLRLLATTLLQHRAAGTPAPLPLIVDLRDLPEAALAASPSLDQLLDQLLAAQRPTSVPPGALTADTVRKRLQRGNAVLLVDGLDDALTSLTGRQAQQLLRQLLRPATDQSTTKVLLACRREAFRSDRDQLYFFLGDRPRYRAVKLLPWDHTLIHHYLAIRLGSPEAAGAAEALTRPQLQGLVERPACLAVLAELPTSDLLDDNTLSRVIDELASALLARDEGRHILLPEHKLRILAALAQAMRSSGQTSWPTARLDDWVLEHLQMRRDLRLHYPTWQPESWTRDLRVASLLSRSDGDIRFVNPAVERWLIDHHTHDAAASRTPRPRRPDHVTPHQN